MRTGSVRAFGDQPLPTLATRLREQRLALLVATRGDPDRPTKVQRRTQQRLATAQRQRGGVLTGEMEQIEGVEEDGDITAAALLKAREARLPTVESDDLTVAVRSS